MALNYHNWQQKPAEQVVMNDELRIMNEKDNSALYKDIPEYCYSATKEEIAKKDFRKLLQDEKESQNQLINAFKTLGYEL